MERKGYIQGDTFITGIVITLKDGTTQFVEAKEPILYKTAEENNNKE